MSGAGRASLRGRRTAEGLAGRRVASSAGTEALLVQVVCTCKKLERKLLLHPRAGMAWAGLAQPPPFPGGPAPCPSETPPRVKDPACFKRQGEQQRCGQGGLGASTVGPQSGPGPAKCSRTRRPPVLLATSPEDQARGTPRTGLTAPKLRHHNSSLAHGRETAQRGPLKLRARREQLTKACGSLPQQRTRMALPLIATESPRSKDAVQERRNEMEHRGGCREASRRGCASPWPSASSPLQRQSLTAETLRTAEPRHRRGPSVPAAAHSAAACAGLLVKSLHS